MGSAIRMKLLIFHYHLGTAIRPLSRFTLQELRRLHSEFSVPAGRGLGGAEVPGGAGPARLDLEGKRKLSFLT